MKVFIGVSDRNFLAEAADAYSPDARQTKFACPDRRGSGGQVPLLGVIW